MARPRADQDIFREVKRTFSEQDFMASVLNPLLAAAFHLSSLPEREKDVKKLQDQILKVLESRESRLILDAALEELKAEYALPEGDELSDLDGMVEARVAAVKQRRGAEISRFTQDVKELMLQECWGRANPNQPLPAELRSRRAGDEEDDDVEVNYPPFGIAVTKCPISQQPVAELENPCEDQNGIVYGRNAIEEQIKKKGGQGGRIKAPTGANYMIGLADLKPSLRARVAKYCKDKLFEKPVDEDAGEHNATQVEDDE